uniref:Protein arginine N-methyltransferase 7 n=1 Tax=Lygus hesperus TaxID=30085 RepID=A0A146KTV0_LYGHE
MYEYISIPVDTSSILNVSRFDFFKPITANETTLTQLEATEDGEGNVLCVYWTLDMDQDGETVVSCAPEFVEPTPWRDHWMQAVYHLKSPTRVCKGDEIELVSKHDQYSMWFDIHRSGSPYDVDSLQMPACTCGLHGVASRTRLYAMNDSKRWAKYMKILTGIKKDANILYIGDTSLLPLAAAKMGANKVFCIEESALPYSVMNQMIRHNKLEDTVILLKKLNKDLITGPIDFVISEPYFRDSSYPWDGIRLWYLASELAPNATIYPGKMRILGVPMEFDNLHKIRAPLEQVEGFDVSSFDKLIESASKRSDAEVDVQPMFEYPGKLLSLPQCLLELTLSGEPPEKPLQSSGKFTTNSHGAFHGVVLWAEWDFGCELISTGLEDGEKLFDMGSRQGVYFIKESCNVAPQETLTYEVTFSPQVGTFSFTFKHQQPDVS